MGGPAGSPASPPREGGAGVPSVVIAVPIYEAERFLPETLASIAAQDHPNLRVVLCDDASTDGTAAICAAFRAGHPNAEVVVSESRRGWIGNHNDAIRLADGADYFGWFSHDDLMAPDYVSTLVGLLEERPDAVLAYGAAERMDDDGSPLGRWPGTDRMDVRGGRLRGAIRYLWWSEDEKGMAFTCIARASAVRASGGLREIRFAADDLWVFRMALLGAFAYAPRPLVTKRMHLTSVSAQYGRTLAEWREYLRAHHGVVRSAGLPLRKALILHAAVLLRRTLVLGRRSLLSLAGRPIR